MRLRTVSTAGLCGASFFAAIAFLAPNAAAAEKRLTLSSASSAQELGSADAAVERMLGEGTLHIARVDNDALVAGRQHERMVQTYKGVPIFGGEIVRQVGAQGVVSILGTVHDGIGLNVNPRISAREAETAVARLGGKPFGRDAGPQLVIYPRQDGSYVLAYRVRALISSATEFDIRMYFIDAATGAVAHSYTDLQAQSVTDSAVGTGTGVIHDQKKLSVRKQGAGYNAADLLRPPRIYTYDYRGDLFKVLNILDAPTFSAFIAGFVDADLAVDADNTWTDAADVDAHAYSGFTYDYYFKRFGRRGLDNANLAIRSIVHPVNRADIGIYPDGIVGDFYLNAAYLGGGLMMYGEGLPDNFVVIPSRQHVDYWAGAIDVVGHELTHGVTDYTSGLIYENESGALNESFSDMMGTSVEFFFQPARADYLNAEDIFTPGGLRSMQNPQAFGDPDHYSIRFLGSVDNGGVHTNSGIPNHVYYLAIEGGTNRVSHLSVQGVGAANREQIEKVMYTAFTNLPAGANFATARVATIQAARDLYGSTPSVEQAITQAWTAVGVN